jgi:hypothetical protein
MSGKPSGDLVRLRQMEVGTPNTSAANTFGTVASGWMTTTATGDYYFWAPADDVAQLWIYDASGNAVDNGPVATSSAVAFGGWGNARSAAVRLEANRFYRFEVRHVEVQGSEYFRVGYALSATATAPQALLGATTPLASGAAAPISVMPDFAGSVVTVRLSVGAGGTLDVGRANKLDKAWTVGSASVANLTIQGDRTSSVTLIGSLMDIQAFLATEGNVRYSVRQDEVLKVSIVSASMPATTNGTSFATQALSVEVPVSALPTLTGASNRPAVMGLPSAGGGFPGRAAWETPSAGVWAGTKGTLGDPALGNLLDTLGRRSGVGLNRDTLGGME